MWQRLSLRRRRFIRIGGTVIGLMLAAWIGLSFLAAYVLTSRARSQFVERIPETPKLVIQEQRLRSSDGETIGSWYIAGRADLPAVILIHGNGGSRISRWPQAMMLKRSGHSVMLITCRAHGDSTGKLNDFGFGARHDVVAAVRWMQEQDPNCPIVIWGASLGSAAGAFAMSELKPGEVRGLILECPYRDLDSAVWNRMQLYLPSLLNRVGYAGIRLARGIVLPHLQKISPLRAVEKIPTSVPVLILAGGADKRARPHEAEELHDQIKSHSQIEVFENADHLMLNEAAPERYQEVVLKYLEQFQ